MSFLKVNTCDIVYTVDEDNRTVTARLDNVESNVEEVLGKYCGTVFSLLAINGYKFPEMPVKFEAVAKCSDEEPFIEEKGKRVARFKLFRKIASAEYKYIKYFQTNFATVTEAVNALLLECKDEAAKRMINPLLYLDKK